MEIEREKIVRRTEETVGGTHRGDKLTGPKVAAHQKVSKEI